MNRVRNLVTQDRRELFSILHEIQKSVRDVDAPTRNGERIRSGIMNQKELEGMLVVRLRNPSGAIVESW